MGDNREKQLGIEGFTINEEFRLAIAIKENFQGAWKDKTLGEYTDSELTLANLRTICPDEVILDFEDKDKIEQTKNKLAEEKISYALYDSGSRGVHFHIKFSGLLKLPIDYRNFMREQIIRHFESDLAKKSERTLIAIPGKPHWKTGRMKKLLEGECQDNQIPKWVIPEPPKDPAASQPTKGSFIPEGLNIPCPALQRILDDGVGKGKRNQVRAAVVTWFSRELGLSKEAAIEKVLEWNQKCQPPEDERKVIQTALAMIDNGNYAYGCSSRQEFCPFTDEKTGIPNKAACKWLKKYYELLDDSFYRDIPVATLKREPCFSNPIPKGNLISDYIDCFSKVTDAYEEYHLSTALAVMSMLTDRRAMINLIPEPFFPSLWMMLIGDSSISRKSTAIRLGKKILTELGLANRLMPDDSSPEGMIKDLSEKCGNAQRIFLQEEFEEFFASLGKDYKSGLAGTFCKLYDSPGFYARRLTKESAILNHVFMPLLTATTIQTFSVGRNVPAHVRNGLFARMRIVYPQRKKRIKPVERPTNEMLVQQKEVIARFRYLYNFFYRINLEHPEYVEVDQDAISIFNAWYQQQAEELQDNQEQEAVDKRTFFNRLQADVWKIAFMVHIGRPEYKDALEKLYQQETRPKDTLEILEASGRPSTIDRLKFAASFLKIDREDVETALKVAAIFSFYSERFISAIGSSVNTNSVEKVFDTILRRFESKNSKDVLWNDALRFSHITSFEFNRCIDTLVESNKVRVIETDGQSRNRRPLRFLRPLDPDEVDKPKKGVQK